MYAGRNGQIDSIVIVDFLVWPLILSIKYSLVNAESRWRFLHCFLFASSRHFFCSSHRPFPDYPTLASHQNQKLCRMSRTEYKYQRKLQTQFSIWLALAENNNIVWASNCWFYSNCLFGIFKNINYRFIDDLSDGDRCEKPGKIGNTISERH